MLSRNKECFKIETLSTFNILEDFDGESINTSKLKYLIITITLYKMYAIYFMYITGYNSLSLKYDMTSKKIYLLKK